MLKIKILNLVNAYHWCVLFLLMYTYSLWVPNTWQSSFFTWAISHFSFFFKPFLEYDLLHPEDEESKFISVSHFLNDLILV